MGVLDGCGQLGQKHRTRLRMLNSVGCTRKKSAAEFAFATSIATPLVKYLFFAPTVSVWRPTMFYAGVLFLFAVVAPGK